MKSLTPHDVFDCGLHGKPIRQLDALATYADEKNWRTEYLDNSPRVVWVWQGPVTVGYELAQFSLKDTAKGKG